MLRTKSAGIFFNKRPTNERRRYNVTSSLIGWAHAQNDPRIRNHQCMMDILFRGRLMMHGLSMIPLR